MLGEVVQSIWKSMNIFWDEQERLGNDNNEQHFEKREILKYESMVFDKNIQEKKNSRMKK
jgi:hypothetical protein